MPKQRWVLVSGAGSGIGRAISKRLSTAGYGVVLLGRNSENLQATAKALGDGESRLVSADVRQQQALREGLRQSGITGLHGLVANAGIGGENQYGPEDRWHQILETNLTGVYNLVNEALPLLKHSEHENHFRHIVVISSILARLGVPGYTAYCASKAGLLGLMRSWASTFTGDRILVNALCPGWVSTDMAKQGLRGFAEGSGQTYQQVYEEQMAMVPLGKMSRPEEIADLVEFLISPQQVSITGQTFDVNNGALMPC